jgi:uncharacterized protein YjbI with pentapeptide repeats
MKKYVVATLALSVLLPAVAMANQEPLKANADAYQQFDAKTNISPVGFTASDKSYSYFRPSKQWTGGHGTYTWKHDHRWATSVNSRPVDYSITGKDFAGKNYALGNFGGYELSNANFKSTILTEAQFENTHLNGADFSNAHLMGANFRQSNLVGANFAGADLTNTKFYGADLRDAKYNKYTLLPHYFEPEQYGMIYLP